MLMKATVYTRTVCPKCMLIKMEVKNLGLESSVQFVNIDHDEEAKEKLIEQNFTTVPVLEISGEFISNEALIMERLQVVSSK